MDLQLLTFINHLWLGSRIDTLSRCISQRRGMLIIRSIVIALAVFFRKKSWKVILLSFAISAGLFYLVAELGLKTALVHEIWIRPRPYVAHMDTITPIGKHYSDSSFPSSHTALTLALLTVLVLLFPALRPYALVYALLMARSRMHNGMHYPSDVLAWAIVGIWCGLLSMGISKKILKEKK